MELNKVKIGNNYKYMYEDTISDIEIVKSWEFRSKRATLEEEGLRLPQFGALTAIQSFWTVNNDVATIVMPTGTGKTETMIATIVEEKIKHTVIVVPSNLLRQQTVQKVCQFGVLAEIGVISKKSIKPVVILMKSLPKENRELEDLLDNANILVTTMSLAAKLTSNQKKKIVDFAELLIVDEAHHIAASSWSQFKALFRDRKILQFTATPFRNDGKKIDGKIIYNYPLIKAQEEGYFQRINFYPIHEFNELKSDISIAEKAIECLKRDIQEGREHIVLVRTTSIKRAEQLFDNIYNKYYKEYNPVLIVSKSSSKCKREGLEALRRLESRIVVCVDMFGEGIDIPNLKIAAIHDRYQSLPITLQFIGRFARTSNNLGNASVVTNVVDENIKESLKELYSQDSDWNVVLSDLSQKAIGKELSLQELEKGFRGNGVDGISIKQINPKVSMQAFRLENIDVNWNGWKRVFTEEKCKYYINEEQNVLIIIEAAETNIEWSSYREINNINWELHIVYVNKEKKVAFVNSSVKSIATKLVEAILGECEKVNGEKIFRCLQGIKRLMLGTVGLNSAINGPIRYKMFAGVDIAQGISEAQKSTSTKSNLFGIGYNGVGKVSIGCSYKGTIWARWVESIDFWMQWCNTIIDKIFDETIDVEEILDGVLKPQEINQMPSVVPYRIDWPVELGVSNDSVVYLENGIIDVPIYNADLKLLFNKQRESALSLSVETEHFKEEILFELKNGKYKFSHIDGSFIKIHIRKREYSLIEFFMENPPTVKFVDQSMLQGNYYITLKVKDTLKLSEDKITRWNWKEKGVDICKESQGLGKEKDSIQYHVLDYLKRKGEYAIIFDDDNSGEIADIVAIKIEKEKIAFEFYHCKFSHEKEPGSRVADLYEVCGQAEKSVEWKQDMISVVDRMIRRENGRINQRKVSRIEKGDLSILGEIRNRLKLYPATLEIYIVQPGVDANKITDNMHQILMACATYLMETYGIELRLICS